MPGEIKIPCDPVVWIERLEYVNETSSFSKDQKKLIAQTFVSLKRKLETSDEQKPIQEVV